MPVLEFQQKFLSLAHHVPDLVSTENTKIHRFIQALGGVYTERMEVVSYANFGEASAAAVRIENTRRSRGVDTSGQGPAKRTTSASGSSAAAGRGQSGGFSSGSTASFGGNRSRGRFRRFSPGGQRSGQHRGGSQSYQSVVQTVVWAIFWAVQRWRRFWHWRAAGGQSYQFGQQRSFACYRCGSPDHMVRDCPHAYVTGTPTFSAGVSQPAAGASASSSPANQAARSGGQQGRGQ